MLLLYLSLNSNPCRNAWAWTQTYRLVYCWPQWCPSTAWISVLRGPSLPRCSICSWTRSRLRKFASLQNCSGCQPTEEEKDHLRGCRPWSCRFSLTKLASLPILQVHPPEWNSALFHSSFSLVSGTSQQFTFNCHHRFARHPRWLSFD